MTAEIIKKADPDQAIYNEVMAIIALKMGSDEAKIENYFFYPYPQRLDMLRDALKWWVLREIGNYEEFIRVSHVINGLHGHKAQPLDNFLLEMCEWLKNSIESNRAKQFSGDDKLVMSMLVWGDLFVGRTLNRLFRSWLAEGNIDHLCQHRDVILQVHTTEASKKMMEEAEITQNLKKHGVSFDYVIIPDSLIKVMAGDQGAIYWLVGASAAVGVAFARDQSAAFHHVIPDSVYSRGYFRETLRIAKSYPAIMQYSFRTDETILADSLKPYEKDGVLSVEANDLATLALNAIHLTVYYQIVNTRMVPKKPVSFPAHHMLMWEGEDDFHIHSPHLNAIYFDHSLLAGLKDRFYMSFDSELDFIVRDDNFYITRSSDYMYSSEMTAPAQFSMRDQYVSVTDYCQNFWRAIGQRDLLKFYKRGMTVGINRALRKGHIVPMTNEAIKQEINMLIGVIEATDPHQIKDRVA